MIPDTYRAAAGFLFHVIRAAEVDQPEQVVGQPCVRVEVRPCGCVGHIDRRGNRLEPIDGRNATQTTTFPEVRKPIYRSGNMEFSLDGTGKVLARTPRVLRNLLEGLPDEVLRANY